MKDILKQNIIKDLGLEALSEEEQEEALLSVGRIIFQAVLIRVLQELDDQGKDEFDKLLSEKPNDEEAILKFLTEKVPNLNSIVREEVSKFKQETVDFMKKIRE
jgi:hypothetical protein